ncbi:hypothetical protein DES53_108253 [Roseimicrobium gellanilyticum]|uniref:Uncharacterized protein n=1 Tax=Roseimicrobium gellanilyticum TaxID=748857 RepID=A0A366HDR6_9BACT|nr:hypothetical protein [Roseimicrobium gellanilyticum]RBP40546.1 hypothetical protein DES53_108253 [Roseimicrobium gellanilyticum]
MKDAGDELAHAVWRVNFLQRLLDTHRATTNPGIEEWSLQESAYEHQLEKAKAELARLRQRSD